MKIEVAKTERYSLVVDTVKNRIYVTMTGFWKSPAEVPNFLKDWDTALSKVKKGFTVLTDHAQRTPPTPEVKEMFIEIQKRIMTAGLRKTAELLNKNAIVSLSIDAVAKKSGMLKADFFDGAEAEAWLDEE